jgi:hypothetical protein
MASELTRAEGQILLPQNQPLTLRVHQQQAQDQVRAQAPHQPQPPSAATNWVPVLARRRAAGQLVQYRSQQLKAELH